jgi:signal peptidase I
MKRANPEPGPGFARTVAEWTGTTLIYLFAATTLVQGYVIPTPSMDPTLLIGDHVFVDKLMYSPRGPVAKHFLPYREPKHGDIIVFRFPLNLQENYVKRVVGVPGDRIRIENRRVIRNGVPAEEPYAVFRTPFIDPYRDNFPQPPEAAPPYVEDRARRMLAEHVRDGELVVPDGHYFTLGDNRDNSADSRYWGLVPRENIIGTPVLIYWSYDTATENLIGTNVRHFVDLATNFFSKTRWNRALQVVRNGSPEASR